MTDMGPGSTTLKPYTVMAEEHPPSPEREDETLLFRRLRVKPAMTARGKSPEVLRKKVE